MKNTFRIVSLLLVLLFSTITFASAETFDISDLSFSELVVLKLKINLAIMQCDEWKQVTVHEGTYIVGEDIPAGDYTVTYTGSRQSNVYIYPSMQALSENDYIERHNMNPDFENATLGKLSLSNGQVITIQYGSVVFSPYIGLGF